MENLKKVRTEKGVSQQVVADFLGITRQAYSNYENGNRGPDNETLLKLGEFFGVSVGYLLGAEQEKLAATEDDELNAYLDALQNREEMRMLFSLAKGATKEEVEKAVRVVEALLKK